MASVVEICNLALNHIGAKSILSLDEPSENARKCKLVYEMLRDSVLRDHSWNFATANERLALLSDSVPGWSFLYAKPSRCLNVRKVYSETTSANPTPSDFKLLLAPLTKSQAISSNIESAWCEFTYQVTDPALFDAKFIEALSFRIGAALAQSLAGNIQLGQALLQMSMTVTEKAILQNSKEGSEQKPIYSSLIEAR